MAKSHHQSANERKIIQIEDRISDEKVRQADWKLKSEIERTRQTELQYQQSQGDTQIEQHKLDGKRHDIESARIGAENRKLARDAAETRLGMAQDELRALSAERGIKQKILAENLNGLSMQASQLKEENQAKLAELQQLYNRTPQLRSGMEGR
jgi:hypothetical protein